MKVFCDCGFPALYYFINALDDLVVLCFMSLVSFTGSYTEDEPKMFVIFINMLITCPQMRFVYCMRGYEYS